MFPFPLPLEIQPSQNDIEEEEEEEEEEEVEEQPNELTISINEDITECFALFDKNKSGTIEAKYLEKAINCLGIFLTTFELEELKENLVKNGLVSLDGFQSYAFDKIMELDEIDSLKLCFKVFDQENEGAIPVDRFKRWMTTLGNPLTEKEAKELAKLGDPGNKGLVSYDELTVLMLQQ